MRNVRTLGLKLLWRAFATATLLPALSAHASMTVLVGEPFGNFGTMMPVGHTAIYLDHVCADGPLKLRMCRENEPQGVVVARYHRIGNYDWIASPVMEFLFAVDRAQDVLPFATPENVWDLREKYRVRYMRDIVPDGTEKDTVTDEWWETAGVAYNRKVWGYQVQTTRAQDEHFVAVINADPNIHRYHLKKTNCANFTADMVNLYFPGVVKGGDHVADFGLMTPKQVARSLYTYGKSHPELELKVFEIPQVPGTLRRSRPVRGGAEAGLKTKRYLFTLAIIQPEIPVGLAFLYLAHGRWQVGRGAEVETPDAFEQITGSASPAALTAGGSQTFVAPVPQQDAGHATKGASSLR